MASKIHKLKTDYKWFDLVDEGYKTAEIRLNDRDYKAGDIIVLQRVFKGVIGLTEVWARITHVMTSDDFKGLSEGYVMLSFYRLSLKDVYLLYEGMQLGAQKYLLNLGE